MESTNAASTLTKKKIHKGKLKKTIKNVLCRPDPVFWPTISDDEKQTMELVLSKYKIEIPEFKKPLWKDLKSIPKDKRPKPPKIERVEGLLFGISECCTMIQNGQCSGIILEATINPRSIVQPLLEVCSTTRTPAICFDGLRKITLTNFGIPTSCLGVKTRYLADISEKIFQFGNLKLPLEQPIKIEDVDMIKLEDKDPRETQPSIQFEYLYRTNKKCRVFTPPSLEKSDKSTKKFIGQDFIEFSGKPIKQEQKPFKKMIVKRISNNPNRVKVK